VAFVFMPEIPEKYVQGIIPLWSDYIFNAINEIMSNI